MAHCFPSSTYRLLSTRQELAKEPATAKVKGLESVKLNHNTHHRILLQHQAGADSPCHCIKEQVPAHCLHSHHCLGCTPFHLHTGLAEHLLFLLQVSFLVHSCLEERIIGWPPLLPAPWLPPSQPLYHHSSTTFSVLFPGHLITCSFSW